MHDTQRPDILGLEREAYGQSGFFTAQQGHEHRVSRQLIEHHVRGGRFERVRRGLYRIAQFPSGPEDEMREKWMAVGREKAILSHESALALLDLSDNIPDAVHLLVSRRHRGLRRPSGVVIHTRSEDETVETVWRDGLPATAPARTLVDVLDQLQPEQSWMAIRQAEERGMVTRQQLRREAGRRHKVRSLEVLEKTENSS